MSKRHECVGGDEPPLLRRMSELPDPVVDKVLAVDAEIRALILLKKSEAVRPVMPPSPPEMGPVVDLRALPEYLALISAPSLICQVRGNPTRLT